MKSNQRHPIAISNSDSFLLTFSHNCWNSYTLHISNVSLVLIDVNSWKTKIRMGKFLLFDDASSECIILSYFYQFHDESKKHHYNAQVELWYEWTISHFTYDLFPFTKSFFVIWKYKTFGDEQWATVTFSDNSGPLCLLISR